MEGKGEGEVPVPSRAGNGSLNMSRIVGHIENIHDCGDSILLTIRVFRGSFDNSGIPVKKMLHLGRVVLCQDFE